MHRILYAIILALTFPSVALAGTHRLQIVASFSIIADMAKNVAGKNADVRSLVPKGGDAHVYEPTPSDLSALATADIVLVNGLGFEPWMDRLIEASATKAKIITVSTHIRPLMVNDSEPDPHAWQDISNGLLYVANIRDALMHTDPANATAYKNRASNYLGQLAELEVWVRETISAIPKAQRRAIISHDSFHYFATAYDMEFIPARSISTAGEPGAADIARIIDQIRAEKVQAVFLENMTNPALANLLAEETGARLGGTLYSDSLSDASGENASYIALFRHNVKILTEGLKK